MDGRLTIAPDVVLEGAGSFAPPDAPPPDAPPADDPRPDRGSSVPYERAGLVDEIDIEFLPAAIGGRGTPALFDAPPLAHDEAPVRLELLEHQLTDDDHLRYAVRNGSGPQEHD